MSAKSHKTPIKPGKHSILLMKKEQRCNFKPGISKTESWFGHEGKNKLLARRRIDTWWLNVDGDNNWRIVESCSTEKTS